MEARIGRRWDGRLRKGRTSHPAIPASRSPPPHPMPSRRRKRLDPSTFTLDVDKIREGAYSERSAVRAREILSANGRSPKVVVQISAECRGIMAGTDEAIAILKLGADDWNALTVYSLHDGERVDEWETAMTVEGE